MTLQYAPLAFNVNVSGIGNKGWKQGRSETVGTLSGYTVTYHISTSVPANNKANGNIANSTATSVTGKNEATTYYVWATAKKGTNVVGSTNYMTVKTGHTHTGNSTSGGGCYGGIGSDVPCYYKFICDGFMKELRRETHFHV